MTTRLANAAAGPSAAATALGGVSLLAGGWLVVHGLELSITFESEPPESSTLGGWMFLAGIATLVLGSFWASSLAEARLPWARAVLAVPAALATGYLTYMLGHSASGPWFGYLWLFVPMSAAIAVLAPPRNLEWGVGFLIGCVIASGLHDGPWFGPALLALTALVTAVAIGECREAARP
jgi:hypothetical protein